MKYLPFFAAIFMQAGLAGMDILSKVALNQGVSNYVLIAYRHAVASVVMAPFAAILDREVTPKMTMPIFFKMMVLGLLGPVIALNLYFLGLKYTSPTFAAAMDNTLPAITFVVAWILRLENVNLRSTHTHGKVIGTLATVAGAMVITLTKGPVLELFWTKGKINQQAAAKNGTDLHDMIKGGLMITVGCFSYTCFMILQAATMEIYPAELSLTVWICLLGTLEATIAGLIMEKGNVAIWAIKWDSKLLTAVYSGIICSGLSYYIQGMIMKYRGPVYVTAFIPLSMVIVAIISSFVLAEQMYLGRIIGAIIIIVGLYLVLWGKSKDYKSPPELLKQNENGSSDNQAITVDAASTETSIKDQSFQEKKDSIPV